MVPMLRDVVLLVPFGCGGGGGGGVADSHSHGRFVLQALRLRGFFLFNYAVCINVVFDNALKCYSCTCALFLYLFIHFLRFVCFIYFCFWAICGATW